MDWNEILEIDNIVESVGWVKKLRRCRAEQLPAWVSTFHEQRLSCSLVHDDLAQDRRGSYNWTVQVVFANGEEWIVRFPKAAKVRHADEKVEIEVSTLQLIRDRTDIPVPEVKAWGLAVENQLGLGPFVMMNVIKGIDLADVLQDPKDPSARLMRSGMSDEAIEIIYRQIARYMLQLSKLDFPHIGSLSRSWQKDQGSYDAAIDSRPFTWKAHEILVLGGVDVYCQRNTTFSSTTQYFAHIADGDLLHLDQQPCSVDDEEDARQKFVYWTTFKDLIARHVSPKHDHGPFKLICDDFGPANMIVNNDRDLKIIGLIDWEWSYAGPTQLFWSPPHWLILESPNMWSIDDEALTRYEKYLETFTRILEEEERTVLPEDVPVDERPSALMREGEKEGRMWFHHIIRAGYNGPDLAVWKRLREATADFDQLTAAIPEERINAFVVKKMQDLAEYDPEKRRKKKWFERFLEEEARASGKYLSSGTQLEIGADTAAAPVPLDDEGGQQGEPICCLDMDSAT